MRTVDNRFFSWRKEENQKTINFRVKMIVKKTNNTDKISTIPHLTATGFTMCIYEFIFKFSQSGTETLIMTQFGTFMYEFRIIYLAFQFMATMTAM